MNNLRVGVVRGGSGQTFNSSIASGAHVLGKLPTKYRPVDILVDQEGIWHLGGLPIPPERALAQIDVLINTVREETPIVITIIRLCESHNVPYVGAGNAASSLAKHREIFKNHLRQNNIRTPFGITVSRETPKEVTLRKIFESLSGTISIRPITSVVNAEQRVVFNRAELSSLLDELLTQYEKLSVEEFIRGLNLSVSIVENFRNNPLYTFIPMEVKQNQYEGDIHMYPAHSLSDSTKIKVVSLTKKLHVLFGARHYSQTNLVLHQSGAIYVTDFDTHPYLGPEGIFMKTLESVGARAEEFLDTIVSSANYDLKNSNR